ncbi:Uncharacterized protein PBTT_09095 [Plasmodiophora brassicae]|uniref:Uncharacterized protein n=1 Tax=Plasmodiophora brassicae TaxID=37360 RepID=A0A3P3YL69_PLABS|nr:unnamed protein product [Plasmodiophora brassicae]
MHLHMIWTFGLLAMTVAYGGELPSAVMEDVNDIFARFPFRDVGMSNMAVRSLLGNVIECIETEIKGATANWKVVVVSCFTTSFAAAGIDLLSGGLLTVILNKGTWHCDSVTVSEASMTSTRPSRRRSSGHRAGRPDPSGSNADTFEEELEPASKAHDQASPSAGIEGTAALVHKRLHLEEEEDAHAPSGTAQPQSGTAAPREPVQTSSNARGRATNDELLAQMLQQMYMVEDGRSPQSTSTSQPGWPAATMQNVMDDEEIAFQLYMEAFQDQQEAHRIATANDLDMARQMQAGDQDAAMASDEVLARHLQQEEWDAQRSAFL